MKEHMPLLSLPSFCCCCWSNTGCCSWSRIGCCQM